MNSGISQSQAHCAVKRALSAQLAIKKTTGIVPHYQNLEEFLVHGLKYVFIAKRGEITRGTPTLNAAKPLSELIVSSASDPPPVWPDPNGETRGMAFEPLCKYVPSAARSDQKLYKLLVLVDAIRGGQARERKIAIVELKNMMGRK